MSLLHLAGSGGTGSETLYPEDVFSTYLYTGNGTTQNIVNGIDLAGKGGMTWLKRRTGLASYHYLVDSARGANYPLFSNDTSGQAYNPTVCSGFNSNGFSLGSESSTNGTGDFISWTFRKAPKFFDVVTYTGNGVFGRQIPHNLGCEPGMVIIKRTDTTSDWYVAARLVSGNFKIDGRLNTTAAFVADGGSGVDPSGYLSAFTFNPGFVSNLGPTNTNGGTYVAYLFAHDPSADGIIQCGSFTTDANGNATVNLGWEPQFLITKTSSATDNWTIQDSMRGLPVSGATARLFSNMSNAEDLGSLIGKPNSTGFSVSSLMSSTTYIYLAIRRPMKVPTSGTEVFSPHYFFGDNSTNLQLNAGFSTDLFYGFRTVGDGAVFVDRLRGKDRQLYSPHTFSEYESNFYCRFDSNLGPIVGHNPAGVNINGPYYYRSGSFKRAPGFFDIVCYTGTGVARTINHNLGAVPELIIVKMRSAASNWQVYNSFLGADDTMRLNATNVPDLNSTWWNYTVPTNEVFSVGDATGTNTASATYVAYLFATLAGISKVGSYTGNGTSQTIPCGFSTGARFVLSKAVSTTGNWNVGDSTRGITSGTDPLLCLNTTAAEVTTDDWLDPESSGFIVNETASAHANTNGVQYIFLAIA